MANKTSYLRRGGEDYGEQFAAMFPRGRAWPADEESVFQRVIRAVSMVWGDVDARAADLLMRESDPRVTVELLPDWEAAFGLPDPCISEPLTVADRQNALVQKMTTEGGQSRAFFTAVAARLGYAITIHEFSPFMAGVSRCGETRDDVGDFRRQIGHPDMRFFWRISAADVRLTWFRAGSGQVGTDPHLRIGIASDLECLFRRWKPAHTDIVFDYSGLADAGGPMAGTP